MTPGDFIAGVRRRGVGLTVTAKGGLRVVGRRLLTDAERSYIAASTAAIVRVLEAQAALDAAFAAVESGEEAKLREQFRTLDRANEQLRLDRLALRDPDRVAALVAAARVDARTVREWATARTALLRRQFLVVVPYRSSFSNGYGEGGND